MNEYLILGLVGAVALVAGLGVSWIGKIISGNKNKSS